MKLSKTIWCALLMTPAIFYYASLLWLPDGTTQHFIMGAPATIVWGILVMLWAVVIGIIYAYNTKVLKDE